jgi:hypothetical protein
MARKPRVRPKISLLIPFTTNDQYRRDSFRWLLDYWQAEMPDAEIIIGHSPSRLFCKTEALNRAAKKANGKVLVLLDADAYISGDILNDCADTLLEELEQGYQTWYVPYRHLYRLNESTTSVILESDPKDPIRLSDPPPDVYLDNEPHAAKYGRSFAALIYMIPREAFDTLGCFDERFNQGWGGEDISTLRALDVLWGKHKTTDNGVFHLWHPKIGDTFRTRAWQGQLAGETNRDLAIRYKIASQNPSVMRELVDEGCEYKFRRDSAGIIWDGFDPWMLDIMTETKERNKKFL